MPSTTRDRTHNKDYVTVSAKLTVAILLIKHSNNVPDLYQHYLF